MGWMGTVKGIVVIWVDSIMAIRDNGGPGGGVADPRQALPIAAGFFHEPDDSSFSGSCQSPGFGEASPDPQAG